MVISPEMLELVIIPCDRESGEAKTGGCKDGAYKPQSSWR
jgi:hypothetical protein